MCELIISVVDRVSPNPINNAKLFKAGDTIVVEEDTWPWGYQELVNPEWRILRAPGIPASQALSFLGPELDTDPANPNPLLRLRGFRFDLSSPMLPAAAITWLADSTRTVPIYTAVLTFAQLMALKKAKS